MAEEKEEKKETAPAKKSSSINFNKIMDLMSYVAVCFGGLALLVATLFSEFDLFGLGEGVSSWLSNVANIIGWIVLCLLSSKFIKNKKKVWMWVVWAIAIVMIIVGIILV